MNWFADCGDQSIMALDTVSFRKIAALVAAAGTLFWLYTFYFIAHVPPGDGTGFQWLAVFPLGMIFMLFFVPAWLLIAIGRLPRFTAALAVCGLIAFAVLWAQLLQEFPRAVL
ncbi:hypothetical protein RX327_29625 [Bradyrhizobium sp. BEA-2-5]|uniref:hypothetical protein n=1 Tax=Bradyrhizobium sp. BEA-2-5 TaxID=3080015 RepID=UPI00293ECFFE|nr:hypothetical protein [Bradyrhizobium sp. BEA-2-5]WOH79970.1 hypothetical protein RX327_29625 [Bradyrhizobium sp. BEA-2-5]